MFHCEYLWSRRRLKLVSWEHYGDTNWYTMVLSEGQFTDVTPVDLDFTVVDIVADPTKPAQFIVAAKPDNNWSSARKTVIHSVTDKGQIIWSSPELLGEANGSSLKVREQSNSGLEILFGSSYGMSSHSH